MIYYFTDVLYIKVEAQIVCSTNEDCAWVVQGRNCKPYCDFGEVCECYIDNDHPTTTTNVDSNLSPV